MDSSKFNKEQVEAITAPLGQTLVIAGAGSGKTSVLTHRIEYLVNELKFYPSQILGITFTNKAANEMKERLKHLIADKFNWIGTFHSICLRILREDIHVLGRSNEFTILDEDDQIAIVKDFMSANDIAVNDFPYRVCVNHIGKFKENNYSYNDLRDEKNWKSFGFKNFKQAITNERIIKHYLDYCDKNNYLDFNDLLSLTLKVLGNLEVKKKWQEKFKYILIDEFQDTNDTQYELIRILSEKHQNVFAVGDPDQMIYSWRGASENITKKFRQDFNNVKIVILNQNYRSTQEILDASNNLIRNNINRIHKDLIAQHNGVKPLYYEAESQDEEAIWVANRIQELKSQGYKLNDILVLYRSNYLSRTMEEVLFSNNIPYVLFGGTKFYNRKEIKDIIAYLRVIYFHDDLFVRRIINTPRRGISQQTIDIVSSYAEKQQISFYQALMECDNTELNAAAKNAIKRFTTLMDECYDTNILVTFDNIMEKAGYKEYLEVNEQTDRLKNIEELKSSILKYQKENPENTFNDYLQEVSLYSSADENVNDEAVHLMTIHIAKGLEYKCVFMIGMNEGVFPSKKSLDLGLKGVEEERRVAYVGITRAKEKLYLSSFHGYNYVTHTPNQKSRFIDEISSVFYERVSLKFKKLNNAAQDDEWFDTKATFKAEDQYRNETINFKIGDRVTHKVFGYGVVVGVHDENIDVSFNKPHGMKTLIKNHTAIKRVVN